MTSLRATLRPSRTELLGAAGIAALVTLAAVAVVLRLAVFNLPAECRYPETWAGVCAGRQLDSQAFNEFVNTWASKTAFLVVVAPYLIAVILGIGAVAKEMDQRTAVLAWSLSPSRRRWLLARVVPFACVAALAAVGSELLVAPLFAMSGQDLTAAPSFVAIPLVGLGPVAAVLSTFGISTLIGAMLGRILPALLASIALALAMFVLVFQVSDQLMRQETIVGTEATSPGDYGVDALIQTADGQLISFQEAWERYGNPETGELPMDSLTQYVRFVPVAILPQVAARYALLHLVVALAAMTLAAAFVDRRVPH